MWGNALGWILSALLVLATAAGMMWVEAQGRRISRADAFGLDPANTAELTLPDPSFVVPSMKPSARSAGEDDVDRTLIAVVESSRAAAERFARDGRLDDLPSVQRILSALLAGAGAPRANIFAAAPQQVVNYDDGTPAPLAALELAGKVGLRAAMLRHRTETSSAKQLLEAAFALGHRLFAERLTYAELDLGLRLMAESAAALKLIAREDELDPIARIGQIDAFDAARLSLARDRVLPTATRVRTLDGRVVADNAGNVMHWSKHAGDRVWRVESILALGRLRFFVGTTGKVGDAAAAARTLDELATDPDPVIQTAVDAARNLSQEQFRRLR